MRKHLFWLSALMGGGAIFLLVIWRINQYAPRSLSAFPQVEMSMVAPSSIDLGTQPEFVVALNLSGQKVLAADLSLTYDPTILEYYKDYAGLSGISDKDLSGQAYFQLPLSEATATTADPFTSTLKALFVSSYTNASNPSWSTNTTLSFKFRAKGPGTTKIYLSPQSKLAGAVNGIPSALDIPGREISALIVITGTHTTTLTPTTIAGSLPLGTPTVTPTPSDTPTPTPTPGPRFAECNACGYCLHRKPPDNVNECMKCLYPGISLEDSLRIDSYSGRAPSVTKGKYFTQIGCLDVGLGSFSDPQAAGGVLNFFLTKLLFPITGVLALLALIYGAFLLMTAQDNPEQIQRGRSWIIGAIVGVVFVFGAILFTTTIGKDILKIPGLK